MDDFIVIGSGFGGSVAALRLAQKGYRVRVLEKGRRYRPEDFARSSWNLPKFLWMPRIGLHGIQCLTLLRHVLVLHGAGVGGGSLVYANQLLVPPDSVFDERQWGGAGWKERLSPFYAEARRMLGAVTCPSVGRADTLLAEVGRELRGKDTFHVNEVGVFFGEPETSVPDPYFHGKGPDRTGCTLCGACMVGCRDGGKNTLDKNYLYLAEQLGVSIVPETEVTGVRPAGVGYAVRTRRATGFRGPHRTYTARAVVFSGGVMGTVPLLMNCKRKGWLPNLSGRIGDYVRTNSEALLGVTARDRNVDYSDHIAINSGIYPDDHTHIEVVRYPKGSDAMSALTTLLVDGGSGTPRALRFAREAARHPMAFVRSLWPVGWAARTAILLVMQTAENHLRLGFQPRWWGLGRPGLNSEIAPGTARIPTFIPIANEVARRLAEKMNGQPQSCWTEVLFDIPVTAHILGGAVMGESPNQGVTDFSGRVFGYPNLYVADGSVVPANLGVNPALTITALAEYILSKIPKNEAGKPSTSSSQPSASWKD